MNLALVLVLVPIPWGLSLWQDSVRFVKFQSVMIQNLRGQWSGRSRKRGGGVRGCRGRGESQEEEQEEKEEVLLTTEPLGQSAMGMISA